MFIHLSVLVHDVLDVGRSKSAIDLAVNQGDGSQTASAATCHTRTFYAKLRADPRDTQRSPFHDLPYCQHIAFRHGLDEIDAGGEWGEVDLCRL